MKGRRDSVAVLVGVVSIAKAVLLCGRQGIALRGHSDNSVVDPSVDYFSPSSTKYGNFNSLLLLPCSAGDADLITHLTKSGSNSKFVVDSCQNEMIKIAGQMIQAVIVERVKKAGYYSIMADGTTDIYKLDQFCLVVRYLFDASIYEDFLENVVVSGRTTGEELAEKILDRLKFHGLDPQLLRGQGYDGASNMTGVEKGTKSRILELYPKALFTHCGAHVLNLALSDSCKILSMVKMYGTVQQVAVFFSSSAKRMDALDASMPVDKKGKRTKLLCPTRWASREVSLSALVNLLDPVTRTLDDLSTCSDTETRQKAVSLSAALSNFEFIVAVCVGHHYMELTAVLSTLLQGKQLDFVKAMSEVATLISLFEDERANYDEVFNKIYCKAVKLAQTLELEPEIQRRTGRQAHGRNIRTNDPEEYYRVSVGVEYLDHLIRALTDRFSEDVQKALKTAQQLPAFVVDADADFTELLSFYDTDLPNPGNFDAELARWKKSWSLKPEKTRPQAIMSALNECDAEYYPNIRSLLTIFAVLPVSVVSCERSFSTLKRLKSYLRSTMAEDRLVGLALLNIHTDIAVSPYEVATRFMQAPNRRVISG